MHHRPPGNCNYAGVLIVWDKIFGTFRYEDDQMIDNGVYGLAKPLNSFDPLWANFQHFWRMLNIGGAEVRSTAAMWLK